MQRILFACLYFAFCIQFAFNGRSARRPTPLAPPLLTWSLISICLNLNQQCFAVSLCLQAGMSQLRHDRSKVVNFRSVGALWLWICFLSTISPLPFTICHFHSIRGNSAIQPRSRCRPIHVSVCRWAMWSHWRSAQRNEVRQSVS